MAVITTENGGLQGYERPGHGIFRFIPDPWVPYAELMRLDRQSGFWAFYWHYLIGLGYAINVPPMSDNIDMKTLAYIAAYLGLWTTVFRGITCTWNDNLDQDFDRQVARCRIRPIPRGALNTSQAHIFTAAQIVAGACILSPYRWPVLVHASANGVLLFVYPLLKRLTNFPQIELGLGLSYAIFTVTAMLGKDPLEPLWDSTASLSDRLSKITASPLFWSAGYLYAAGALWCVTFDTVYAHQDYGDDLKAGVKGLAVRLGRKGTKPSLSFAAAIQVYCLVLAGNFAGFGIIYYAVSCTGAAFMLAAMLWMVELENGDSCAWWFGPGSGYVGLTITAGLLAEFVVKKYEF